MRAAYNGREQGQADVFAVLFADCEGEVKHIVGLSGGIDSQRTALWVRQRYDPADIILLNTTAGENEHPLTTAYIEQYNREVFPVTVIPALMKDMWKTPGFAETRGYNSEDPLTFETMILVKGRPPSLQAANPDISGALALLAGVHTALSADDASLEGAETPPATPAQQ